MAECPARQRPRGHGCFWSPVPANTVRGRASRRQKLLPDQPQYLRRGGRNVRARPEDRADAGFFQEIVVLRRDHAAADDEDVAGALLAQRVDQGRDQGLVAGGLAGDADDVDVVFDCLAGGFLRGLEQRADIDVETDIGEGGGDDLGAAVVTVLGELYDQHARAAGFVAGETLDLALYPAEALVALVLAAIDADHRLRRGAVPAVDGFERVGNFADRRARPRRLDRQRQQVAVAGTRRVGQRAERRLDVTGIAGLPYMVEPRELRRAHRRVVDVENIDMRRVGRFVLVDADNDLLAAIDRRLPPRGRFLDAQFRHAAFDRLGHAAQRLDLVDQRLRRRGDRMGQALDVIAAAERVDDMRDAGLLG